MLTFDEKQHRYFDGEIELPSVTTITRFCNYDSLSGKGSDPFYRERGTKVHELCADYDFTGEFPQGTGLDGYLKAYADFVRDYRPKWDYIEYMVGSVEKGFAGTIDRMGTIDGRNCILDIKTSSKVNVLALTAQLTGYSELCTAGTAVTVNGDPQLIDPEDLFPRLYGLQLQKKGNYRLIPVEIDRVLFGVCQVLDDKSRRIK